MKHEYTVRAHRTETKYDTRDNLMSLLDVQVPADALEFLRSAHNAQDSKDVTFVVEVINVKDGELRRLKFNSKGSKMKDFVPVATLEKWCDPQDNLTALFDDEPETVQAGVLNAPKEVLALPTSEDIQDADFFDLQAFLESLTPAQLSKLLIALDFWELSATPDPLELATAWERITQNWSKLEGSDVLAQIKAEQGGDAA